MQEKTARHGSRQQNMVMVLLAVPLILFIILFFGTATHDDTSDDGAPERVPETKASGTEALEDQGDSQIELESEPAEQTSNATFIENVSQAACYVELYQHGDFGGWKATLPVGQYNDQQMFDLGAPNDDASSMKVVGSDCIAEVYENSDFTGWRVEFSEGEYPHEFMLDMGASNDAVSSIKIYEEGPATEPAEDRVLDLDGMPEDAASVAQWLLEEGAKIHPCISIEDRSGRGKSVVARCEIHAGERLLMVPPTAIIMDPAPGADPLCKELEEWLKKPEKEGGAQEMHLNVHNMRLVLRLMQEKALGDDSRFVKFLRSLPSEYPQVMADKEVQLKCFENTPHHHKIERRFQRRFAEQRLLHRCHLNNSRRMNREERDFFQWAQLSIGSRAYMTSAPGHPDGIEMLVPFADYFNHAPDPTAAFRRDDKTGGFLARATAEISAGEEIVISYGPRPNDFLLAKYGFMHPDNLNDVVKVPILEPHFWHVLRHHAKELTLSLDIDVSVKAMHGTIKTLRQANAGRPGVKARTGYEIYESMDIGVMKEIRNQTSFAAHAWVKEVKMPDKADAHSKEMCNNYRYSIAAIADAGNRWAGRALKEVHDPEMVGPVKRTDAPTVVATASPAAKNLTQALFDAWKADLASLSEGRKAHVPAKRRKVSQTEMSNYRARVHANTIYPQAQSYDSEL